MKRSNPARLARRLTATMALLALAACQSAPPEAPAAPLTAGASVAMTLSPGDRRVFSATLTSGQYLEGFVRQQGVDIAVALIAPDGSRVFTRDTQTVIYDEERFWFLAETAGPYRLEIEAIDRISGACRLEIATIGAPDQAESLKAEAFALMTQAEARQDAEQSTPLLVRAAAIWQRAGMPLLAAECRLRISYAFYLDGAVERAIAPAEQAAQEFERLGAAGWASTAYVNWAALLHKSGKTSAAREALQKAIELGALSGWTWRHADALLQFGKLCIELGCFGRALDALYEAASMFASLGDRFMLARVQKRLALLFSYCGLYEASLGLAAEAQTAFASARHASFQAAALLEMGWAEQQLGMQTQAVETLERAVAVAREAGDRLTEGVALDRLGSAFLLQGRLDLAQAKYEAAYRQLEEISPRNAAATQLSLAELRFAQGRLDRARELANACLAVFRKIAAHENMAAALTLLARIHRALGDLESARAMIEEAMALNDGLREDARNQTLSMEYGSLRHDRRVLAVDTLAALADQTEDAAYSARALTLWERGRALPLRTALAQNQNRTRIATPPTLLARKTADGAVAELGRVAPGGAVRSSAPADVDQWLMDLEMARARLRQRDRIATQKTFSLTETQTTLLNPDTALLVFALGEKRGFLWEVHHHDFQTHALPPRQEIAALAHNFIALVGDPNQRRQSTQRELLGDRLSQILWEPVAARLAGKRVLLVKDDALYGLPFAALPHPDGGFIVERHELVTLPSAAFGAALMQRERPSDPPRAIALFANPAYAPTHFAGIDSNAADGLTRASLALGLETLPPLTHTAQEGAGILALFPEDQQFAALGVEATRENLLGLDFARYDLLHFAVHGLLNSERPQLSGLALATVDRSGQPIDGFLAAHEFEGLDLSAELATLSACNTALGKPYRGEGLWGLSQTLLANGAARVVSALWRVDDRATAALMPPFYKGLVAGLPPAEALRRAQRGLMADPQWADPYFWSAFELQGDWRPLFKEN